MARARECQEFDCTVDRASRTGRKDSSRVIFKMVEQCDATPEEDRVRQTPLTMIKMGFSEMKARRNLNDSSSASMAINEVDFRNDSVAGGPFGVWCVRRARRCGRAGAVVWVSSRRDLATGDRELEIPAVHMQGGEPSMIDREETECLLKSRRPSGRRGMFQVCEYMAMIIIGRAI